MKKLLGAILAATMVFSTVQPAFASMYTYDVYYYNGQRVGDSIHNPNIRYTPDFDITHDVTRWIYTDEYIMVNGTAMVRMADIVRAAGGSISYDPDTKTAKAYFHYKNWDPRFFGCSASSMAAKSWSNNIPYTLYCEMEELRYTSVPPRIINGSMYVSAADIGAIMAENSLYDSTRFVNGKLYIPCAWSDRTDE